MRTAWYVCRRIWKSMGIQFIVLLISAMLTSFCVEYTVTYPIYKLVKYARYAGTGMENSAIFTANIALDDKWGQGYRLAAENQDYVSLRNYIEEFADVATSLTRQAHIEDDRLKLWIYNDTLIKKLELPQNVSGMLSGWTDDEYINVILDERLDGKYSVGDIIEEFSISKNREKPARVAGFIPHNSEMINSHKSGSQPSITYMLDSENDEDDYIAIASAHNVLSRNPDDYAYGTLLLFPKNEENIDEVIADWRGYIDKYGAGSIMTYAEMMRSDLLLQLTGEESILGLICVWSLALLLIGLSGFTYNISCRLEKQISVYRICGMKRGAWNAYIFITYALPVYLVFALSTAAALLMFNGIVTNDCHLPVAFSAFVLSNAIVLPLVISTVRMCTGRDVIH